MKELSNHTFMESLHELEQQANQNSEINLEKIFSILSGKGYPTLLILFSFPFCIPIQIPGFSTPFGLILCFLGLRIAFGKSIWWPKWILEKKIKSDHVKSLIERISKGIFFFKKIIHPRMLFLTQNCFLHRLHGLLVFLLSLFLSLPLPIPLSNMLAALPIFFLGLGLLEDDGLMIIISYFLAFLCFVLFMSLFIFGKNQLDYFFHN